MTALLWLASKPRLVAVLAVAALVLVTVSGAYIAGRGDGADAVRADNQHQDGRADNAARSAAQDVAACSDAGGAWDVSTGRCR